MGANGRNPYCGWEGWREAAREGWWEGGRRRRRMRRRSRRRRRWGTTKKQNHHLGVRKQILRIFNFLLWS